MKTGKNRRGFRAREESVERLEDRTLLTKTLGIEVRLFTDSNGADAGGAPGTEIVDDRLNVGDHFFAEIFAGDLRDGSDVAAGIVGLGIDLTWNAAAFQSLNDPLDPAAVVTDRLPLVFSNVALDQNAGRILNLGGASLPPFVGAAVGVNQLESFALLHFRADAAVEDSPFRIAIGDDGSNLSLRDDAKGFNVDVEAQTITVIDPNTATLTVDVVADAVSEGAGAAATTATVTRSSDTSAALTVNLTSSDTSEATVPTTVMIPAGQASASFDIDAVDDTIIDGTQTVTITATAAAHDDGTDTLDVTDNDTQSLVVTPLAVNVNEGSTNTFSVRLNAQPTADVTVNVSRTAGDTDLSVSAGGTLTFTTSNWDTPQDVTLAAAEDADAVNGSATFTVSSAGLPSVDVTGTEVDNDEQSLLVTPVTLNVNEGGTNTFSVRLAAQPAADVTVSMARTAGDTDLSVSAGGTLTFTTSNWDTPQNVTLAAAEDADAVNGAATFTVSSAGLTSVDVTGTEVDNDTQSLVVTPVTLNVNEGATNTFSVRLAAQPTADVTVAVARTSGDTDLSVSAGATLTFTSPDWDTPQNVTLAAGEDADAVNGAATFTVSSTGLTSVEVTGNEVDNDTQSLVVTPLTLNVDEGNTNTFSVRLAAQPTADVTVNVARTAGDTDLSVSAGGTLTFTSTNWDTPQDVTLSTAEDADAVNGSATFTVSSAGLTSVDVTGNEVDNDTQSLVVTPVTLNVNEGATNTFSVRLASQPTADVTVAVARTAGDTDLSVSAGGTLTFTTSNWDTPQDVTLAAAEDADAVNGAATFTVSSTGLTSVDVTGTEVDNDTQSLVVTPVTLNVDEGATNTFSVRLAAQPTADVTVTVARTAGDTDLSVSAGGTLTFTIANWDTPQDVTLAAAEDADAVNGAATFTVSSTGLTSVDVTGTEVDNDTQSLTVEITADSVSEAAGAGATTGTVTRNTATTAALTVTLTSSDTSEATVPATVTIPAGQASATFDVDAIDDAIVDGIQTVTITASATAHADGTDSVDVADDDGALLTVVIAVDSVSESAGAGATTATVSRSSDVSGPLTVTLTSSDTSEATVPASITIPAGQTTSLPFDIDAIDDALPDGTQTVTITATAAAHADGSDTVDVTDDDVVSLIIDDGDAGYSQIGPWLPVVNYGYAADAKVLGQNRAGSATWTFVGLAPGQYRVSATWLNGNDRAINAPYSIRDGIGGPALSHVSVNQKVRPSGVEAGGRQFASLDVVSLTGDTLVVELTSTGVQGAIIADAVRIDTIEPVDDVPEILVSQGTATLRDGTLVDFGTAIAGDPLVTRSFQVSNTGTADLILEPIVISGAGFTLESPNFTSGQMVAPGGDVTFTVGMSTATVGNLTGAISFGHNDGSQNPFDLSLSGTVIAAPPAGLRIIDNGDPGFSQTGNWANV
ncbi:MAG: choice-of-anchor D domain-containing protein, partial [Fuerstiella sp.]